MCEPVQRQQLVFLPIAFTMSACANSPAAKSGPAGLFSPLPLRHCSTNAKPLAEFFIFFSPFILSYNGKCCIRTNADLGFSLEPAPRYRLIIAHQPIKKDELHFLLRFLKRSCSSDFALRGRNRCFTAPKNLLIFAITYGYCLENATEESRSRLSSE